MPPFQDPRARSPIPPSGPGQSSLRRATASLHLHPFEGDLERLGRVPAVARVERRAVVLGRPALEQVVAKRLLSRVVEQDDGDALARHLAVDHRLAPVEELLRRREVPGDLHAAGLLPPGTVMRFLVVAVLELDHLVLVLESLDGVTAAHEDAVHLDVEPVGEVEVALGLGASHQALASPLHGHAASPRLRPPSRAWFTAIRTVGPVPHCSSLPPTPGGEPGAQRSGPRAVPPLANYLACPAIWPMRKMTNSAGFTGAMPISQTIWPASTTSGGLVSASHLTKNASSGVLPIKAPEL